MKKSMKISGFALIPQIHSRVLALKRAKIDIRAIKQTRHTLASIALALGEDPNWIAKVMGHADTQMIFKYYAKYVKNATGATNGQKLNDILLRANRKQE